jgi:hypothetical protein
MSSATTSTHIAKTYGRSTAPLMSACANVSSNIQMDVMHDSDTNYFSQTMVPVYNSCNLDYGSSPPLSSIISRTDHETR